MIWLSGGKKWIKAAVPVRQPGKNLAIKVKLKRRATESADREGMETNTGTGFNSGNRNEP